MATQYMVLMDKYADPREEKDTQFFVFNDKKLADKCYKHAKKLQQKSHHFSVVFTFTLDEVQTEERYFEE